METEKGLCFGRGGRQVSVKRGVDPELPPPSPSNAASTFGRVLCAAVWTRSLRCRSHCVRLLYGNR